MVAVLDGDNSNSLQRRLFDLTGRGGPPSIDILSIYTLSDLGVLSNLIGLLSLANEHYSSPTE